MKAGTPIAERWDKCYRTSKVWNPQPELLQAIEELSASEERERVLRKALERVEWIMVNGRIQCPACLESSESGHGILCQTDEALRPTPEKAATRAEQNALYAAAFASIAALATPAPQQPAQPSAEKAGE